MKIYLYIACLAFCFLSCQSSNDELIGAWDDKQGQVLIFHGDGEGEWVFYKNPPRDTFEITYKVDRSKDPSRLDLTLKKGALDGKSLYGVYKIDEKGNLQYDCESEESARPTDFSSRQTKTYVRID